MRKSQNWIRATTAAIVVLTVLLTACAGAPQEEAAQDEGGLVDGVLRRGVLKVGLDIFVPWAFKDKDGNLVGFEVDVANKLAEDIGVEVEFVPTEWSGIIPALLTGKFDVIIGGMGITAERALKVNFSIPYEAAGVDFAVNKNLMPDVTNVEELNREDVIIAVRLGTTGAQAAKRLCPNAEFHEFDTDEALWQDVLNGNSHAGMENMPTPAMWVADHPDVLYRPLEGDLLTYEPCGFAVRKGDPEAVFFFDAWIRENQLWLEERYDYWYGSRDWEYLLAE